MTGQCADLRGKSVDGKLSRYPTEQASGLADLQTNPGLVPPTKPQTFNCGLLSTFPKPPPKRDRAITKAPAVSPLSPQCPSVLRPNRALLKEFLVTFVSKTKVTRPSACEASGAKWHLADFASAKPCF